LLPTVPELDRWRYCPRCRAELDPSDNKVECPECGFVTYASSKPTASAVCFDGDGRVLLSRRGAEPFKGCWDFPGGFLEEGEGPLDCLRRELREEAGVEIEPVDFLGIWTDVYGDRDVSTLNLYWTARIGEGDLQPADDVAELRWFAPEEVPRDELAFSHLEDVLGRARAAPAARF
jgi:ADP-ribose pyrophosphatase YjhB (NUDIX family)